MAMSRQRFQGPGDSADIVLFINGEKHTVRDKYPVTTSLNDYLRNVAGLKGTKAMCNEAGCGCCAVAVTHAVGGDTADTFTINSCLCLLYSTDGWQISTVEGIGNQTDGFHPIQERIAKHNGTQCGYCTPGFVMSMYGLLHQKQCPSQQEIEDSFDSHICRCTGYRPILDAMKSFAIDSTIPGAKCIDIEDLNKHLCPKTGVKCDTTCSTSPPSSNRGLQIDLRDGQWHRPTTLQELSTLINENKNRAVKLIFGNTASGIFKNEGPFDVYIDLHSVAELYQFTETSNGFVFGASTTLTKFKDHLGTVQKTPGFEYCEKVIKHLKVLASVLVRNAGCIAGNLMIKHNNPEFPSDLFTLMEAIGASVTICDPEQSKSSKHSLDDFLRNVDMKNKVIISLEVPKFANSDAFRSFKISPRSQNVHAYVNGAFNIPLNGQHITKRPSIVYGGINGQMTHAVTTEAFLTGKTLDTALIKDAVKVLSGELKPSVDDPLLASAKYRKNLAINLLYKTLLDLCPEKDDRVKSGGATIERPLSSGIQTFHEKSHEFPLKKAIPKLTAPLQASGEAVYVNDTPTFQRELFGSFVIATVASGTIASVDTTPALDILGVIRYISAEDIPDGGVNNYMALSLIPTVQPEEVFTTSKVLFAGQPIGLILAETAALAKEAALKVKVAYTDVQKAVLEIDDALEQNSVHKDPTDAVIGEPEAALKECDIVISGEVRGGSQYYFYLENQVAVAVPTEDGIDLYSATQILDQNQRMAAELLAKPMNYVNMIGTRVGGSFGGKAIISSLISSSAALGAYLTKRPVRINLDLSTDMMVSGKRFPILAKYKAGLTRDGKMQVVDADLYVDSGCNRTVLFSEFPGSLDQGYFVPNWRIKTTLVKTNKPTVQSMRGPGSVPAAQVMETIMEHAAKELDMHPIDFKEKNLYASGQTDLNGTKLETCTIRDVWQRLKQIAGVEARMEEVNNFNKNNTWRKRGITMTAVKYGIEFMPPGHTTNVSVFAGDGTITVMTTGCEMGQGLYTKVAQAVSATLGVPIDTVKVRPGMTNVNPNPGISGGSSTSELCVQSAVNACKALKERLQPIREKMPDADWKTFLTACNLSGLELSQKAKDDRPSGHAYFVYCSGVAETEVDVLTGEYQISRVDIMCDFGESLNPTIDIGQVEGAYVMGLGSYLMEDIQYDATSGVILNDGTWEYKPPTTKDIPIDWRIHFLPDSPNVTGILSSKAVGEPPIGLSIGALLSIKRSIEDAREELTGKKGFIPVDTPYTVEKIQLSSEVDAGTVQI